MGIKLYRSQAQIDTQSTNVSASKLAISPSSIYASTTKSAAQAGSSGIQLWALVKKTKDANKAASISAGLEKNMGQLTLNYERSNNINDLSSFNSTTSIMKDQMLLKENSSVKRKVNSWFASKQSTLGLDLQKTITKNILDEKVATDEIAINKHQQIVASSTNRNQVNESITYLDNYFNNSNNKLFYTPAEWIKKKEANKQKIQENMGIALASNDPKSIIDNPKHTLKNIKDTKTAEWILEKAYENHAANIESEIQDQEIIDAKNLGDQAHNFAEIAVRIKNFHENADNPDFSDKLIHYKDIKRAFVNNDIDETMYHKLIDYRAGVVPLNDERLTEDINEEIFSSDSPIELQALSKRVQVKESDLTFLGLSAEATGRALKKINALKKDSKLYNEYKSNYSTLKAVFFASESYEFEVGEDARTVKAIGSQAIEYYDNLVMNEGINSEDALFETIAKFNPGAALPNMSIFPLPSFQEESDWSSQIIAAGGSKYFIENKTKMAEMYRDGKLNHDQFVFEMDNLGKAQKLFDMRYKYALSDLSIKPEERLSFASGENAGGFSSIISNLMKKK